MVCTSFVWVDLLGGVFGGYGRDKGDITSSFEPFIQLVNSFGNGGILFGRSAVEIWSGSRNVLASGR